MAKLVLKETVGRVGLCRLNRPEARNALSPGLREELAEAVADFDADEEVHCIVIAATTRPSRRGRTSRRWPNATSPTSSAPASPSGGGSPLRGLR